MSGENKGMKEIFTRLDRMENKIDKMQGALIELARTEERVVQLMEKDAKREDLIHDLQERIATLEKVQIENKSKIGFMWAGLGAAVTTIISLCIVFFKELL